MGKVLWRMLHWSVKFSCVFVLLWFELQHCAFEQKCFGLLTSCFIFNSRPIKPCYNVTWDIGLVISYLRTLGLNANLSSKFLTLKLTALLCILSHSRVHYLQSLSINSMELHENQCTLFPTTLLKYSQPSFVFAPLVFYAYPADLSLCVIATLSE